MQIIYAILLGLIQGITEFLPISSSGHLLLFNKLFSQSDGFLFMAILLHVATLISIIIVLRKEIWWLVKNPFSRKACLLYIATIPTVIIVLLTNQLINSAFDGKFLAFSFLITAILLFVTEKVSKRKSTTINNSKFKVSSAIFMGIAQGLAVVPGISRSGATICTGLICGEERENSSKFSFLMSIPIIIASMVYETYQTLSIGKDIISQGEILPTIIAFIVALFTGIFAIKYMLKIVKKSNYIWFSFYLVVLSNITFIIL